MSGDNAFKLIQLGAFDDQLTEILRCWRSQPHSFLACDSAALHAAPKADLGLLQEAIAQMKAAGAAA